jgi:nucleoside-diphosphate-sugar epimerase
MRRVLVTGANGFVGNALCDSLRRSGWQVRAAFRRLTATRHAEIEAVEVGEITSQTDWATALAGVDVVVHAAARAHVLGDSSNHDALYMETNAEGTRRLAESCAAAGVRRLVFLSSIKVNGEETADKVAYRPDDSPRPRDVYGRSKWAGEQSLASIARMSALEVVVVRPPLVYGPGVKANFLRLLGVVQRGWPLPIGAVDNRRSLVSLWNLCDLVERLLSHPGAVGRTWMVSDGEDLSTPELVRRIGHAMHRRARLVPVPVPVLRWLGKASRREAEVARLCGSLCVDIGDTRTRLEWSPPMEIDEALSRTVEWYLSRKPAHANG